MRYEMGGGASFGFEDLPGGAMKRLQLLELILYKTILMADDLEALARNRPAATASDAAQTCRVFVDRNVKPVFRELLDAQDVDDRSQMAMGARYLGMGGVNEDLARLSAAMKISDKGGASSYRPDGEDAGTGVVSDGDSAE